MMNGTCASFKQVGNQVHLGANMSDQKTELLLQLATQQEKLVCLKTEVIKFLDVVRSKHVGICKGSYDLIWELRKFGVEAKSDEFLDWLQDIICDERFAWQDSGCEWEKERVWSDIDPNEYELRT